MSLGLRLSFDILTGAFAEQAKLFRGDIARAATGAMDDVVNIVKPDARAEIANAGFSRRWQNALRVVRYPKAKKAIAFDPAVFVYHKIDYAGVFADGATIKGTPWLWLPLSTTPKSIGGRHVTPQVLMTALGGTSKLVPIEVPGKPPMLGAVLRVSRTSAPGSPKKVSLAAIKQGNREGTGVLETIPLFVGIRQVTIPKKLDIAGICQRARDRIPALYARRIAAALS